jgi:hypothetical protein
MTARGEGYLTVNGERVAILLTNRALAQAETATGKPILEIANEAAAFNFSLKDVVQLLTVGLEAARRDANVVRRPYNVNDAYDIVDAVGFMGVTRVVMEALAAILSYEVVEDQPVSEGPVNPPAEAVRNGIGTPS